MKSKRILTCVLAIMISLTAFLSLTTPLVRGNGDSIPIEYCQQLNLNGTYIYNVTAFGAEKSWLNYSWNPIGNINTNIGGQICINFTGFYDRDPSDAFGDDFPDTNMPWMDISIYNNTLDKNLELTNKSNSDIAGNLLFNYWNFKPGFLVPKNWTWLNETAQTNADAGTATLTVEESYNFISFDFDQVGSQRTKLIYDKNTGLLVSANTSSTWDGYHLVIQSLNFTLDYNKTYNYDVVDFATPWSWWNFTGSETEGWFSSNPSGVIMVNFTGDYNKDINDWGNIFEDPIPWINISIFENISGSLILNFTQSNKSNSEIARNLNIGYNNFQSAFRIPIDNLSYIEQVAIEQGNVGLKGNVTVMESDLTIKIIYNQYPNGQKTQMIYEKLTGLLLWGNTSIGAYLLEMAIEGYTPWLDVPAPETGPTPSPPADIVYLPYLIVIIASVAIVVPFEFVPRASSKTKKYALLAMLAVSSFSGLLFFNSNMNLLLGSSTFNQRVDNITLIVEYADGRDDFTPNPFSLIGGKTSLYDALDAWFDVEIEYNPGLGYKLISIDGYEPSGGWTWTINGGFAGAITTTALNSGDTVRFTAH